ncbi:hypothetical protein GIB67_014589 [Kingdonia uniflora]|uniref:J domain-containing protein n=1 Tax=Kingdonia uniflora TaxID=39325 RepID=A0A7J7MP91_9MAGN|nr:hypothetical protein GIB67_014589 [Kingdonia uniflora]
MPTSYPKLAEVFGDLNAGLGFALSYERFALFITTVYSIYCAKIYVGWLGLLVGLNLSFISSDVLMHFLKSNINEHNRPDKPQKKTSGMRGQPGSFFSEPETVFEKSTDHSAGVASTSGFDVDFNSEDEVVRLLNCTDHYSALGLTRYVDIDVSLLKREYRRKAMLVHPDKNMGNEKAAEAFKKLQNAYEILLDSLKRKTYDEELKGEELLNSFRRFQSTSHQNGRHGPFSTGFARSEADGDGDLRRITCKKCGNLHNWIHTDKSKSRARWCQGMRCPANTHKPSFHVNTSITSKYGGATKGSGGSGQRGAAGIPMTDLDESMTEEELMEWFQKAMQSGMFERSSPSGGESPLSATAGNFSKNGPSSSSNSKKKKKGKKQR